jgi:hypothetical protein
LSPVLSAGQKAPRDRHGTERPGADPPPPCSAGPGRFFGSSSSSRQARRNRRRLPGVRYVEPEQRGRPARDLPGRSSASTPRTLNLGRPTNFAAPTSKATAAQYFLKRAVAETEVWITPDEWGRSPGAICHGTVSGAQSVTPGQSASWRGRARTSNIRLQRPAFCRLNYPPRDDRAPSRVGEVTPRSARSGFRRDRPRSSA